MFNRTDYYKELQKFTSGQHWHAGSKITAGVMLPLVVFAFFGWLPEAIPFLWGALFVSITDTPGPVHHRRNGMLAATILNGAVVLLTTVTKDHQLLLVLQIMILGFFLTMSGVYGSRAGAVGTLALIVMLLNLLSISDEYQTVTGAMLIAAGGFWYTVFSLLLHGIKPYRPVEQALGEHLTTIADYIRARGAFYKEGADIPECFDRLMRQQSAVMAVQTQTQELMFKTRRFLGDASPKSRSLMMIYLDSMDLFEQSMYTYQDFYSFHKSLSSAGILNLYYGLILELAASLEYVGINVQMGRSVKKEPDLTKRMGEIRDVTLRAMNETKDPERRQNLETLQKVLVNIQDIANRLSRIVLYSRMELRDESSYEFAKKINKIAVTQPLTLKLLLDNLTPASETFRHAVRLTVAMIIGYVISVILSLDHSFWVLLTIVTIMRPAYVQTKQRNMQRVMGTLLGLLIVSAIILFISSPTALILILLFSMLFGYSLLRVNYFGFVVFLTIFVIISLYFLNPFGFQALIVERLVDTAIGSVIAFLAARFFFPRWGHEDINSAMHKMIEANLRYFEEAWKLLREPDRDGAGYVLARQEAIVSLTNLSDNFQRMLAEPEQSPDGAAVHQFVIASHMLTGHIAALSDEEIDREKHQDAEEIASAISRDLKAAANQLQSKNPAGEPSREIQSEKAAQTLTQLAMIYSLSHDVRKIAARLARAKTPAPEQVVA